MESDSVSAGLEDPQRIEAARRLLAEARGEALNRLAALSARLLGAAHGQVSLVTDEAVSLTPVAPRQPSANALLVQTVARGAPLALTDAQAPGIAAFLGVPVVAAGESVGALCVYDNEPNEWTAHDIEVLRELAGTVAVELERGVLAAELESSTVRIDLGFSAAD